MSNVVDFVMCFASFDVSSFGSRPARPVIAVSCFPYLAAAVIKTLFALIETAIENR